MEELLPHPDPRHPAPDEGLEDGEPPPRGPNSNVYRLPLAMGARLGFHSLYGVLGAPIPTGDDKRPPGPLTGPLEAIHEGFIQPALSGVGALHLRH